MSFFNEEDRAARQHAREAKEYFPSVEERRRFSHNWARERLEKTLASIKDTYREGTPGISFSYDRSPFAGSRSSLDPRLDYEMGVAELVRLIRQEGITCTLDAGNDYTKSGFSVTF